MSTAVFERKRPKLFYAACPYNHHSRERQVVSLFIFTPLICIAPYLILAEKGIWYKIHCAVCLRGVLHSPTIPIIKVGPRLVNLLYHLTLTWGKHLTMWLYWWNNCDFNSLQDISRFINWKIHFWPHLIICWLTRLRTALLVRIEDRFKRRSTCPIFFSMQWFWAVFSFLIFLLMVHGPRFLK